MGAPVDEFMRETDAFSWYIEADPALRSTIVAVAFFDTPPDWAILLRRLDRATRLVPVFRQRPLEPPHRLATPRWSADPDFDLSSHIERVGSPPPHTRDTVIEIARRAAMSAFDTAHPLWHFTLVDDLDGGGAALVMKVHHSLTDGIGGMTLLLHLFDAAPGQSGGPAAGADEHDAGHPPATPVGSVALATASVSHQVRRVLAAAGAMVGGLPSVCHSALHPVRTVGDMMETVRSVGRTVAPVTHTLSPLMRGRSLGRHLSDLSIELDELRRASARAGGTLNDGFVAAVAGGLRRYHEHHGCPVDELRVTMPISTRTTSDAEGGNRITLERFTVPVGVRDPQARIAATGARCRAARSERSVPYANVIAGALNLLPPVVAGTMLKHVDFLASNVPGLTFPVYLAGARMTACVPFSPTIGAAINVTLLSYNGVCAVGVTMDSAAVPDPGVLMSCLAAGFDEVLALAGDPSAADPQQDPGHAHA